MTVAALRRVWVSIKWPVPWWRVRGHARLRIGAHEFRFFGLRRDHYVWALMARDGTWETGVRRLLEEELRPGDTFLDVGAHLGAFTLLASRLVGGSGQVYAFEPDPVARELLVRNVRENRAANVTVVAKAVGEVSGWARLAGGSGDATSVLAGHGTIAVEVVSLEDFCSDAGCDPALIKIDVEGGESAVLRGGRAPLVQARAIVVEVHVDQLRVQGVDPDAFLGELATLGELELLHQRYGEAVTRRPGPPALTGNANVLVRPRGSGARDAEEGLDARGYDAGVEGGGGEL